jgi:2-methylisocitrate lyase-like PEP mutase family enzyme
MTSSSPPTARLRELLNGPGIIRSLGAHDVLSALLIEQAGFETVFVGGFGTSASLLGLPDLNFLTLSEMADQVRRMCARLSVPLIADGDTGHGDLPQVQRTVREFEAAGAAGIILEDQVAPKRCGHFEGKQVIEPMEMCAKIEAAKRAQRDPDFVLIARTDAREVLGLEDAIRRVGLYVRAGADVVFIEAPQSVEELESIAARVEGSLLVNMLTGGKTPLLPVADLERMGYKIVVAPIESLLVAARAVRSLAETFRAEGHVLAKQDEMISFTEIKRILGVDRYLRLRETLQGPPVN